MGSFAVNFVDDAAGHLYFTGLAGVGRDVHT